MGRADYSSASDLAAQFGAPGRHADDGRGEQAEGRHGAPPSTKTRCSHAPMLSSQTPPKITTTSRTVCANTGPSTFAAPCDEK